MIRMSVNDHDFCEIMQTNPNVYSYLGWTEDELKGRDVCKLMPRTFSRFHSGLVRDFLKLPTHRSRLLEKKLYPVQKNGYLLPCTGIIKTIPDLRRGIQMAVFLQRATSRKFKGESNLSEPGTLMIDDNGVLLGVSEEMATHLHIEEQMSVERSDLTLNMLQVCPTLLDKQVIEEARGPKGTLIEYDPTYIFNNRRCFQKLIENDIIEEDSDDIKVEADHFQEE